MVICAAGLVVVRRCTLTGLSLLATGSVRAELVSVATSMARHAALKLDLARPALALMRPSNDTVHRVLGETGA
jgi:hypothetical protein